MTEYENKTFEEFFQLQTNYWPKFMSDNFQGWQLENMTGLNEIDWLLVMLNEENPELYSSAISMQERCNQMTNTSCFEVLTSRAKLVPLMTDRGGGVPSILYGFKFFGSPSVGQSVSDLSCNCPFIFGFSCETHVFT